MMMSASTPSSVKTTPSSTPNTSMHSAPNLSSSYRQQQQQQQQQEIHVVEGESDKEKAAREASECLQAIRYEGYALDGFNLLGVVANPRSGAHHRHGSTTSPEGVHSTVQGGAAGVAGGETMSVEEQQQQEGDMFSDAVHSLEYGLAQVTEQIETLNYFLEELSREYLGDSSADESRYLEHYYEDYLYNEKEKEDLDQTTKQPPELMNLNLSDLQTYLEQCGVLAHSLFAQKLETTSIIDANDGSNNHSHSEALENLEAEINEIPAVFFDPNFDLTQPATFEQLLLLGNDEEDDVDNDNDNNGSTSKKKKSKKSSKSTQDDTPNALYQPTQQLIPVKEPESLAAHLDRVELALQEQVRQKSGAFFQETTRFRQLQSSIEDLLGQVQTIRSSIRAILSVYKQTKDISNHQRQDFEQLVDLIDTAMELIRCKSSIGGMLSANDHFGAAQQIQYGRKLLKGEQPHQQEQQQQQHGNNGEGGDKQNNNGSAAAYSSPLELKRLTSLSTYEDQLQQYESLVVQNLSDELVDIFFHWRASEKDRVSDIVQALHVCNAMSQTGDIYKRRLQQTIRMTVRTTIAEFVESTKSSNSGSGSGVTGMTYPDFYNCLEMLIEELQSVLKMSQQVDEFCDSESVFWYAKDRWTNEAMTTGADLAAKSIAELLRLRKEAHSLLTLDEMKQLWDHCLQFTEILEGYSNTKAVGLRSTLLGQAKAFLDRAHESNMSSLVAALDSERWKQCEVSAERQASLTRLCTGRAIASLKRSASTDGTDVALNGNLEKKATAEVEGVNYSVVWSCLLLVEMVMMNLSAAGHFQSLASNAVAKVSELLRLFNSRTTQLVLGAGAIHSAARLKSINARHLSVVTQCLGMMMALLPHIRAALMAQLPAKQHSLLNDLDKIKKDYLEHFEKLLNKFVTIIGGIVEHGLAPRIAGTDFDARAREHPMDAPELACCIFLDGVCTHTGKMHYVVVDASLPPDHLQDVFSRMFSYLDEKIPSLFIAASSQNPPTFRFPQTDEGKRRMIMEVEATTKRLNELKGVFPWDFACTQVLERKLDYKLPRPESQGTTDGPGKNELEETPETCDAQQDAEKPEAQNDIAAAMNESDAPATPAETSAETSTETETNGEADPQGEPEAKGDTESNGTPPAKVEAEATEPAENGDKPKDEPETEG